jgi:hypothetical protein
MTLTLLTIPLAWAAPLSPPASGQVSRSDAAVVIANQEYANLSDVAFADAEAAWRRAATARSRVPEVWFNLALVALDLQRPDDARAHWERYRDLGGLEAMPGATP